MNQSEYTRIISKILEKNQHETSLLIGKSINSEEQVRGILQTLPQNDYIQDLSFNSSELCLISEIMKFVVHRHTITSIRFQECPVTDYDINVFASEMQRVSKDRLPIKLKFSKCKIGPVGCDALAEIIKNGSPIEQIALIHCDIDDDHCKNLVSVIGVNPYLKSVRLEKCGFGSQSSLNLVDALDENNVIEELSLQGQFTTNTSVAVKFLIENPKAQIKRVSFTESNLPLMFLDNLFPYLRKATSLQAISLSNCKLNFEFVTIIAKSIDCQMTLQSLDLSGTCIQSQEVAQLAIALMHQSTLRKLNLSNNSIGAPGAWALFHALQSNNYLQELYLRKTELNDDSCQSIIDFLDKNKTLKVLEIGNNNFSEKELQNFATRLNKSFSLQVLDISYNKEDFLDSMAPIFDLAETSHTLKKLNVSGNKLGPKSVNSLVRMIKNNRTLNALKISNCGIDSELGMLISEAMANNEGLRDLDITNNDISAVEDHFAQSLTTNSSLLYFRIDSKNQAAFRKSIIRNISRIKSSLYHDFEQLAKDHSFM